jgi:hypothetical protein
MYSPLAPYAASNITEEDADADAVVALQFLGMQGCFH